MADNPSLPSAQLEIPALLERRAGQLLDDFGAGRASPGSGSAAAFMGLLAVKLMQTVCIISAQKIPEKSSLFEFILSQASIAEPQLKSLFQDDADQFDKVVNLRRTRDAAQDATEKSRLTRIGNDELITATEYSLDIGDICLDMLPYAIQLFREGWGTIRGDSGAAISAAVAGTTSAIFISNLNLKSLRERRWALEGKDRCDAQFSKLLDLQLEVFACVAAINSETTAALRNDLQLSLDLNSDSDRPL